MRYNPHINRFLESVMTFSLKIEETTYSLWLGENAPILLFEALGIPLDNAFTGDTNIESAIASSLNPQTLFNKLKTFEVRNAIAAIILQEGEFTPDLTMDSTKLARRFEMNALLNLISDVFSWYNERAIAVENTINAIKSEHQVVAPQPVVNIAEGG